MELMNRWLGYGNRWLGCGNQWLGCGMRWWSGTSCHETTPFPWSSSRAALPSPLWSNLAWTGFGFLQDLVPSPISPTRFASCCFCFRNQCNLAPRTNQIMGSTSWLTRICLLHRIFYYSGWVSVDHRRPKGKEIHSHNKKF